MKKMLKRVAILAAPIIWRRIRGRRGHHSWHRHPWYRHRGWHGRPHHFRHKRRRIWL